MSSNPPFRAVVGTSKRISAALTLAGLITLLVVAPSWAQQPPTVPPELHQKAFQRGSVRVLVEFDAPYTPEAQLPSAAHILMQRQSIVALQGVVQGSLRGVPHQVVRDFRGAAPVMALHVGPDGLRQLEALRGVVARVVEDRPRRPTLAESVPRIQADQAVALGYDGTGSVIVIMDTGVERDHPFFQDGSGVSRVVGEACFSSNDPDADAVSLCPGAPSTPGGTSSTAVGSGEACAASIDGCNHGTLVAGIAAGRGPSFNGVAPAAQIISIQVFSQFNDPVFCGGATLTPCVGSYPSDELAGALYVRDSLLAPGPFPNIAAINLSLGSGGYSIPCDANFPAEAALILDLKSRGVATVVASGNEGRTSAVSAPACIDSAISVGATTDPPAEAVASFSNRALGMSLLAPGFSINTSTTGGGFEIASGTSMAAPHVAGVFALFKQAVPTASIDEILEALQTTGVTIGAFKRVRVLEAMAMFPDTVPTLQFSSPAFSTPEGDGPGNAFVTVTRTGPANLIASTTATVQVATGGGTATPGTSGAADYTATSQALTFGPGQTSKTISIPLLGDFTLEPDETVGLSLTSPFDAVLGTPSTATLTITNDDQAGTIEFAQAAYSVNETAGIATITLKRTGGLAAGITAMVSTLSTGTATAGADYTAFTNKVVTFAGGATTASFTVTINNDTLAEADETVVLKISSVGAPAAIGAQDTTTLTIQSDDVAGTVQFSASTYEVTEGTATATITVNRTGTSSGTTIQYRVSPTTPGTAAGGTGTDRDYTLATGTLSFNANETVKTFTVAINNDIVIEPDETVIIELFNPSVGLSIGSRGTATLIIHDDDAPTIKFGAATYRVVEGMPGAIIVTRTGGLGSPVTVDYQVIGGTATNGGVDYTLANGTLTFGVGSGSLTLSVPTTSDSIYEPNETVIIQLFNPSKGGLGRPDTTTLTIADNDAPGTIQFSAATYSVWENLGPAIVRVTRAGTNLASGTTVQFTTTNGTATAGPSGDYTNSSQTLTFAALEAFKDVAIPIRDDSLPEGNETVLLSLSDPSPGASLGATKTAVLTILDDEQTLQFSAPVYVVNESAGTATVTVNRSGPTVGTVTVDYATAAGSATSGVDYTDVSGTLTFGPGIASRTFTVPIVNDTVFESAESISLMLRHPGGVAQLGPLSTSTITIIDNDPPGAIRFSAAAYTVAESAGQATITVQRTAGSTASAVTVDYATAPGGTATPGADYMVTSGTLTFKAGEVSKTFAVPIINDNVDEPNETVNLVLSNPTGGATLGTPVTAVLTISDEDVPGAIGFSAPTFSVLESAGIALITVTRTGAAGAVTVDFTTADGSAIAPADYTAVSRTLSFGGGETSKIIAIPIIDDAIREGNETVLLVLSNPTGGATLGTTSQAVLTITDRETGATVQFGAAAYSVAENVASGVATISITRTGSAVAGDTVLFRTLTGGTAVLGTDYTGVTNQPVTFNAGQTTTNVQVPIINNTNIVGSRTVNLAITSPSVGLSLGSPRTAVLTILEDDAAIQFASPAISVTEGSNAVLTVTRIGGTVSPATVAYTTANGTATAGSDYTAKAGILTFGAGISTQTITIATINDTAVEGAETFTVTLSSPTGATLGAATVATVTINDNDAFGALHFSSPTYTVTEGATASLVVTRTGGSAGAVTVNYVTSNGGGGLNAAQGNGVDYTTTVGVLTFLNGVVSQTIAVPTKADTLQEGPETFTVTLSSPSGGASLGSPAAAVVTIIDDETPRLQFAAAAYTVAEATGAVTITVQRVGPSTAQNTVQYSLAGVTATGGGVDFDSTGGTLTFASGVASRTIVVPITKDTINEPAETFTVTLSNPIGGAVLGTPSTTTVTITDDDPAGTVQFGQLSYAVIEGGTAIITVTRTGTSSPVAVSYATSNGTATQPADYAGTSGIFTFLAGETTKTFTVTTVSDGLIEGSESVNLTLLNPTNGLVLGNPSTATLWILDVQQTVQFAATSYSVTEGGTVNVLVTRAGVPDGTVTVNYQVSGASTATEGADYTLTPGAGTLTFLPGVTTLPIKIQTINDAVLEGPESIVLVLTGPATGATLGSPTTSTVTVYDNERPDLVVTSVSGPAQAATGLPMTIVATVQNITGGMAPATSLGVFLSPSSSTPGAGQRIGLVAIPSLIGGTSYTVTAAVSVPLELATGDYFLSVVADVVGVATEELETNNGLTASAQVNIVVVQPDLVVSTITAPVSTPRGKPVAIPLTIRNLGAVNSGPYRVGVFVSTSPDPTVAASTGVLLAIADMPSLAPGASAAVSPSITPPLTLPQGPYWISAVADLNRTISEPSELNNGLSAYAATKVVRPLNKLSRAAMSLTPNGCGDVSGQPINLGGAFTFTTIGAATATGTLDLIGNFNGDSTRAAHFRGTFTATFNDVDDDLSLSIVFTSITGFFTGMGSASAAGIYDGRVFEAESPDGVAPALTGSLSQTTTSATCTFGGTLTAIGDPAYSLTFNVSATGGAFGGAQTPTLAATPIQISAVAPLFESASDDNFPLATSVKFTGPAGSGYSTPGVFATVATTDSAAAYAAYQPAAISGPAAAAGPVAGAWSVMYKAASRAFTVVNPEATTRLVVLKPSVTLNGGNVQQIDWVYLDPATGSALATPPPFVSQIQAVIQGGGGATACVSPAFDRTATTYIANPSIDPDCQNPVSFSSVTAINMTYVDSLTGNRYTVTFPRP